MRIGIDLGGTKIEGLAIDDDGAERVRRRIPAPRGDYGRTLTAVVDLVHEIEQELGARGDVGVGIPGAVSPATRLIKNANSTWLIGRPLADDLARMLDRPVLLANDANCFALSEATDGAGAGADVVFGVIADRRERNRRRVGAQSAARAEGRRTTRPDVLLRAARLRRNVSFRTRPCARLRSARDR
jgi:predicted NBD/HSP70 family sugar kinase